MLIRRLLSSGICQRICVKASKNTDVLLYVRPAPIYLATQRCFCILPPVVSVPEKAATSERKSNDLLSDIYSSKVASEDDENKTTQDPLQAIFKQSFDSEQKCMYKQILDEFPGGIQMAFAYGSGAFQQQNSKEKSQNMLDFIFVVDKPHVWHRENLQKHPDHYSFLKHFGPQTIAKFQERYGAGVYFNTLIPMQGRIIKYGVVSTQRVHADLLDWESLYISGRLHKPVKIIVIPEDEEIQTALTVNLRSALQAALLLLPDSFTEEELYITIAGLSYSGDLRMAVAEDSNKVSNIVKPNLSLFQQMYRPFLFEDEHVTYWPDEGILEQALTFHSRFHHLKCLPSNVLLGFLTRNYKSGVFPDLEEIIYKLANDSECDQHVAKSIQDIVKKSSFTQTAKGILTAGVGKSIKYSSQKVLKKLKSKR